MDDAAISKCDRDVRDVRIRAIGKEEQIRRTRGQNVAPRVATNARLLPCVAG